MVETRQPVLGVGYAPARGGTVELRRFPETGVLRGPVHRQPVRPDFHVVGLVTGGTGRHAVDFHAEPLTEGSVFWLRPGQVHRVLDAARLSGVLVLFTASALAPGTPVAAFADDALRPSQWSADARDALTRTALRHLELLLAAPAPARDLADALPLALGPLVAAAPAAPGPATAVFERFAAAVEAEHRRRHHVRDYQQTVHASARTIDRAVRRARGVSAKRFLDERIALEARRRLATSDTTVAALAAELGFTEATNFVKFYRRMTGTTPRAT
ncbi:AraC family transcriptional regulator [Amycolatopsis thermalba]|uniref:AraC family transcriptional regulator n=1 Tax=Amycolatopsis thermalba TaxID=944492 RepID=UPI0013BE8BD9|nr:helix-turn-helix transcriptional regulator [Amycolatopsis thermalba]